MRAAIARLRAVAEMVAAGLLAALFATFLLQIFTRYVVSASLGWTIELCLTLWLWLIFWTSAFLLQHRDHVRFDVLYHWSGLKVRRAMALISALAIAVSFAVSFPATVSYVTFYKIKKSATLGWRLDFVFGVYLLFALAMIVFYAWRTWMLIKSPETVDEHPEVPTA
jgi:C4-dicarboxylate transporter, DctQ subunit